MAKLNVTYPAVDVMVNGQAYRKVDRKAQAGDIVKALSRSIDVDAGAYYAVEKDESRGPFYRDNVGSRRFRLERTDLHEVYAPLSVDPPVSPSDELTFEGAIYHKVDRSAREGDVIIITKVVHPRHEQRVTVGNAYLVTEVDDAGDAQIADNNGRDYDTIGDTFDVYEKVAEEAAQVPAAPAPEYVEVKRKAAAGERIRIVDRWSSYDPYEDGAEFTVDERAEDVIVHVTVNGKSVRVNDSEYVVLEPLTVTEPSAKPQRLTVGEYAKVTQIDHEDCGSIVVITNNNRVGRFIYATKNIDGTPADIYALDGVTPATPEEVAEAQAEAQRKIAIGPFANGGFAVVVDASKSSSLSGFTNGDYVRVNGVTNGVRKLSIGKVSGLVGYCNADALRQVTEAEYNVAIAKLAESAQETARWAAINRKVGEFKRGDIVEATRRMGKGERVLGVVRDVSPVGIPALGVQLPEGAYYSVNSAGAALIVPVEQRFDNAA